MANLTRKVNSTTGRLYMTQDEMTDTIALIMLTVWLLLHQLVYNNMQRQNPRKEDIILELGSEFIRMGLVGDRVPRKTIKTGSSLRYSPDEHEKSQNQLEELLYNIFFSYINCPCNGKTVVILEKAFTDRRLLQIMAKIMFRKLKIDKIQLALSCVTPLYLTGRYTGAVISAGNSCIQIMPVFEGYPLFPHYQYLHLGTGNLNKFIRHDLALLNKQTPRETLEQITEEQITDVRNTHGGIPASNQPVSVVIRKMRLKFIPDKINYAIFYGNPDNEEPNIAHSLLTMLASLPTECIGPIAANIVLAGGLWRIKGMQKLLKKRVAEHIPQFSKLTNMHIKQKLGFVSWSFNPSQVAWIGCSIGASVRSVDHLCLRRNEYLQSGFTEKVMKCYFLSG